MKYSVEVEIEEVRAISSNIDLTTQADMYAKIKIGDDESTTGHKENDDHVYPHWKFHVNVPESNFADRIPIRLQLWDQDPWTDPDDQLDINPSADAKSRELRLEFDPHAGNIVGDVAGRLFLTDGTQVSGSELHRMHNHGYYNDIENWATNRIHLRGAGDSDRAELWYIVRVELYPE